MPFESDKIITAMIARIPTDGDKFCNIVNGVFHLRIEETKGGPQKLVTMDLKNKPG